MDILSNLLIPSLNTKNVKLNTEENLAYKLSEESYKSPNERAKQLGDYSLDYNSDDAVVYRKGKDVVVGFRGTKNNSDIVPDLSIATNTQEYSKRFNDSLNLVKSLKENNNVKFVSGHSAGGSISRFVSDKQGVQSYTFNAGQSPFTKGKNIRNSKDFVISTDPISKNSSSNAVILRPRLVNGHSLKNFSYYL